MVAPLLLQASRPGSRLGLSVAILLLLGLSCAAICDWHVNSSWLSWDYFCATVGGLKLRPQYHHNSGMLHMGYCISNSIASFANSKYFVLPFPALSSILLLLSGLNPNPGPPVAMADLPSTDIPTSASGNPVIGSANICGLRGKVNNLQAEYLVPYNFAAFALQETKLPTSSKDPKLYLPDYSLFRKDRSGSGGGVALYVQNVLNPHRFRSRIPPALELIAVEAFFGAKRLILASIYLPPRPRQEMEERISDLSDWLASLGPSIRDLLLLGDLNLCTLDRRQPWQAAALSQLCQTFQLRSIVQQPTHGTRLIDHCLLGDPAIFSQYGLGPTLERKKKGQSDGHSAVWIQLRHLRVPRPQPVVIDSWKWADFDINRAIFLLNYKQNGEDRNLVAEMWSRATVDLAAQFISEELLRILRLTCPHRQVRLKRYVAWINHGLLRLIHRKRLAWRQLKQEPNSGQKRAFWRRLCGRVRTEVTLAKQNYLVGLFEKADSIGAFWKTVRKVTNSDRAPISALQLSDGAYITTDKDKAAAFAKSLSQNYNNSTAFPLPTYTEFLDIGEDLLCRANFVASYLQRLRPDSATGLDQLPAKFLRAMAIPLSPIVTALINRCILEGAFPRIWKRTRVTPIPKIPGTQSIAEFRPISILPILSKLAERWILELLYDYLGTHDHQFGFKQSSGTEDAIAFVQYSLERALASCPGAKKAAVVSLDVTKAFDQCPFGIILDKLRQRSAPDPVLRLLCNYFTDRVQVVKCGNVLSGECSIPSGIGQGTILAPYLFNIVIDGIFSLHLDSNASLIGYADDLLIVAPLGTADDQARLQADLDKIVSYYQSVGLKLNSAKSKVLLCAVSAQVNFSGVYFKLTGQPMTVVSELTYLGVTFSQDLSFDRHIETVSNKAKKLLGAVFSTCSGLSREQLLYLYRIKIQPVLLYALPVCCPTTNRAWLIMERVHRYACRLLLNDYRSSYSQLLKSLNLCSIQDICIRRQLPLCHKYVHKSRHFPVELVVLNVERSVRYNFRQCNHSLQLRVPETVRLSTLPIFVAFRIWNAFNIHPNSVLLNLSDFRHHVMNYSSICAYIYSKLPSLYVSIDNL